MRESNDNQPNESVQGVVGLDQVGEERPSRNRLMITTVVAGHAMKHIFAAGFFILLPELKREMRLSNASIGSLSTSRMVAGGLLNLIAGVLADRLPHRWVHILTVSMCFLGIFYFLIGWAPNFGVLVFAAVFSSIAITLWHPSAIGALARRFRKQRGLAISLHGSGGSVGEALGPLAAGALLLLFTWREIFQLSAIPALLAGGTIWILLRQIPVTIGDPTPLQAYFKAVRAFLGNRRLQMLLVMVACFSTATGSLMTFLPIYLREDMSFSPFEVGFFVAMSQGVGIISQPLMGHLSDRHGRRSVLLPTTFALGVLLLILYVVPFGVYLIITIVALGAFAFPLLALFLASASDIAGEDLQATTVSLVFASTTVFAGVSPGVSGLLADAFGIKTVFLFGGAAALVSTVLIFLQGWLGDRPQVERGTSS